MPRRHGANVERAQRALRCWWRALRPGEFGSIRDAALGGVGLEIGDPSPA